MADGTAYARIEDGMKEQLLAAGSPFKPHAVQTYGAQLSDAEIAKQVQALISIAPACMIFYAGGESSDEGGLGDQADEQAMFTVVYVAAAVARDSAGRGLGSQVGIYELLAWGKQQLNKTRVAGQIVNTMYWRRNRRFGLPFELLTVAAYAQDFVTEVIA